jgi:hypothetical protein
MAFPNILFSKIVDDVTVEIKHENSNYFLYIDNDKQTFWDDKGIECDTLTEDQVINIATSDIIVTKEQD